MTRVVVILSVLAFLIVAGWNIATPGLYYDEMLFVDAALGSPNGIFLHLRLGELPILLMAYIGALKAWLYYPIFKLFGVSAATVRWPVLLLGALTLWINYRVVALAFSRSIALVFIVMAAVEPSTLFHTRLDWGPTALMMLFRGLMLYFAVSWVRSGRPRDLALALAATALGVFDKFNFLWFGPALVAALLAAYPHKLLDFWHRHRWHSIAIAAGAVLLSATVLLYTRANMEPIEPSPWPRFDVVRQLVMGTMAGVGVYSVVTTDVDPTALATPQLQVQLGVLMLGLLTAGVRRRALDWRMCIFFVAFFFVALLELYFTPQATGPHHAAIVAPYWLLPLALLIGQAFEGDWRRQPVLAGLATVAIAALLLSSLRVDRANLDGFATIPKSAWDPGSTALATELANHPGQPIVTVDWGIASIVNGLLGGKERVLDIWPQFVAYPADATIESYEALVVESSPLFVLPAAGTANFPTALENFQAVATARQWTLLPVSNIARVDGSALYDVYQVRLPSQR